MNFMQRMLAGLVVDPETEIDDEVSRWHAGGIDLLPLPEFLGLTEQEYARWVIDPHALATIVAERRERP